MTTPALATVTSPRRLLWCLAALILASAPVRAQNDPDLFVAPFADWAAASPNGKTLLFVSNATGNETIWMSNRDGTNLHPLIAWADSEQLDPDWSPDGQHVVFASNAGASQFNIWIMNPDGTNAIQLTANTGDNRQPRYSPNGRQIAFTSNQSGKRELWYMAADGSNQQVVVFQDLLVSDPGWSPDGTSMVYVGCVLPSGPATGDGTCNLFTIALGANNWTQITSGIAEDWNPDWGPSGIVFASDRGGVQGLWTIQSDGSNLRLLTDPGPTGDLHPRWDRTSNSVVFTRAALSADSGVDDIWSTDLSGNAQQLTSIGSFTSTTDTTPPVTTPNALPGHNANGWNNSDVTITLHSTDNETGGSGVKQISYSASGAQTIGSTVVFGSTASFVINTEGITTITFFGTDNAGNVEAANTLTIKLDKTPPLITPVRAPASNANGWNNTNVTVSFQCSDNLSGLAPGSPPTPTVLSAEGVNQSITGTCMDLAGNSASAVVNNVNIDKTPPVVSVSAKPSILWPPDGKMVPVTISGKMADNLSGIDPSTTVFAVSDQYGAVQPSGIVSVAADGSYSIQLPLEARRDGQDPNGRLYTITISAQDKAGNQSSSQTTVFVPHDQGH
jgi:Tol biopolymer transport system component